MNKRLIGDYEELMAVRFLEKNGYEIIERNYRCKQGEIDIIAKQAGTIVFVEVKYRSTLKYGDPSYSVTLSKQKTIYKVAVAYIYLNRIPENIPFRFDVVTILGNDIKLIKNAFGAM